MNAHAALLAEVDAVAATHLRDLLADADRCAALTAEFDGIYVDFARQRLTRRTLDALLALAEERGLAAKIAAMFAGEPINATEGRAVLHTALRLPRGRSLWLDGRDVAADVHGVLDRIEAFSAEVRSGARTGATGRPLTDVVSIGIGGSYLGPEFVAEALRTEPDCAAAARGRRLRFLANVDPIDVSRALDGLDPATTLVIVVSKTFTTAETMLNARTVRAWLTNALGAAAVPKHMVAVSTNLAEVAAFGIDPANAFGFWDWVGGRYSVSSAVGALPLALHYGIAPFRRMLAGAHSVDEHFRTAPLAQNLPALLALLGVWNRSYLGYPARALLPYCQALHRFPAHIQQVDMESNGKRVGLDGAPLPGPAGEIDFGEPGTNGQHSFYQLLHQGEPIPADFVGFLRSQAPVSLPGEAVSNHDELMSNFFAQPDALAVGRTAEAVRADGAAEALVPHRTFPGNRPSTVILLHTCGPYEVGQLLALFEHRTAAQGFLWGLNPFDQWGVELGKVLAKQVRSALVSGAPQGFNPSTQALLARYLGARLT